MLSVEQTCNILNEFNVSFTENAVLGYLQQGLLQKAPRIETGYYSRNTKFNYSVSRDSLVKMLLDRGIRQNKINEIL